MPRDPITAQIVSYQTEVIPIPDELAYETYVKNATGKIILACFWPEDKTSRILINQLTKRLPDIKNLEVQGVYSLDVYSLPKIAEELDITFVPTLMWFNDRVQDALVWHDGVRMEGEKVSGGVQRVLSRIAESGLQDDGDDAWEGMGGIYRGVGSS
ncbi:hypothetical protein BU25DRAFT_411573 [Macroventuria anomochaeta]|uniref:Uncharacterized protein n=1 Tax=Macroventuria anomochaeta TaxID=301207 RepID=A0ACB6RX34_9PLEO|nr:uncharacterized protein BU25DRAFT_411573 [Macroventuria anomochaeta]KAF2626601.1 hypothetical protein BU25DRAFT_411573 [Macroventuria anomochaeta]